MFEEYILSAMPAYRDMRFEAVKTVYEDLATELCVEHTDRIERLANVLIYEEFMRGRRIAEVLHFGKARAEGVFLADGWPQGLVMRLKAAGALSGLTLRR